MTVINYLIPTYEMSSISCKFGEYILDNYNIVEEYVEKIKLEKKSIKDICEVNNVECILNHINTIYIKKTHHKLKKFSEELRSLLRCAGESSPGGVCSFLLFPLIFISILPIEVSIILS